MAFIITNQGKEYIAKTNLDGVTLTVGMYNDATDALTETSDLADVTTEPTGSAYARQSDTFSVTQNGSNDAQIDNDNQLTYDTSDSSQSIDGYFVVANFQSTFLGDGAATDHIIALVGASQTYDLGSNDTFNVNAGSAGFDIKNAP